MTVAGGSAGHTLAMIYAYRDGKEAPVPVVFTYGGVGPQVFYRKTGVSSDLIRMMKPVQ